MRPRGSVGELERRRRRAIELLRKGRSPREVAQMVGVDRRSVYRWQEQVSAGGVRALRAKPASGRPPKLSDEQRREFERVLLGGAQACGYVTDLWTCPRMASIIEERFGVSYHVDHLPRLMRQLGWSPQKPMRRAIERNEEAIRTWIKRDWPRIKKKPSD